VDNVLDFSEEHSLAALLQPDTVAPVEYYKIYRRKAGLVPEKKLMLAVLQDAMGCYRAYLISSNPQREKRGQEAEQWFNEKDSEWIFSFENICETLGINPQYVRQGLLFWKRKRRGRCVAGVKARLRLSKRAMRKEHDAQR